MIREYFLDLEELEENSSIPLDQVIDNLAFNADGLLPVVTQDADTRQVLMMAWMNKSALEKTLETNRVTYWSRSRNAFWIKGETSGHTQELVSLSFDCDGDTILCLVKQTGAACHTGRKHCFYIRADAKDKVVRINSQSFSEIQ